MSINKFLAGFLIALSIVFVGLQSFQFEFEAAAVRTLATTLLTILYIRKVEKKHILFYGFLVLFAIGDIFNLITWSYSVQIDSSYELPFYFIGNIIYILAYVLLILRMIASLNLQKAIKKFPIQAVLLVILTIFCVYYVSDTMERELEASQYALEFTYNAAIMFLMCLALINYLYHDDKKSINLLIGSIFIVFSEVIQLAYFYVAEFRILNVLCSLFLVAAFTFFYLQSLLKHEPTGIYKYDKLDTL